MDERAVEQLAALQVAILPGSMISRLGMAFVREFYRFASRSAEEIVLWKSEGRELIGGCVASLRPQTLSWRLMFRTTLAWRLLRLPFRVLLAQVTQREAAGTSMGDMPELILLFTRGDVRSRGIGAQLLRECESELARRGATEYYVKTIDTENNRAIAFYLREGFEVRGRRIIHTERFCFLSKRIPVAKAS